MNQKLCCESGSVRVSYKIPIVSKNLEYYRAFKIILRLEEKFTSESEIQISTIRVDGNFVDNAFYNEQPELIVRWGYGDILAVNPTNLTIIRDMSIDRDDRLDSDSFPRPIYFFVKKRGVEEYIGGVEHQYYPLRREFYTIDLVNIPFDQNHGVVAASCYYPDRWQYFEVETPKFNARDVIETALTWIAKGQELLLLNPLDPRVAELKAVLEGIKRFSLLRSCVVTAEQVFSPSQINIAKGLEIGVLENLTLPFVGLEYQVNFWSPVPGFDQIIKTIQSPAGCPPPLIKLECCPEKGSCAEECPPGTCEVNCKGKRCCYDKNGKMVKQLH